MWIMCKLIFHNGLDWIPGINVFLLFRNEQLDNQSTSVKKMKFKQGLIYRRLTIFLCSILAQLQNIV